MKYNLVKRHTTSKNTAEYGFGDYSETNWEEMATCEAESEREAQAKFRKMFPLDKLTFSGAFAPYHAWEAKNEPQRA